MIAIVLLNISIHRKEKCLLIFFTNHNSRDNNNRKKTSKKLKKDRLINTPKLIC
jgi:hypothetical protein